MTKRKNPEDLLKVGRPPLYSDPEVLQSAIEKYFENFPNKYGETRPTITGLVMSVGFCDRAAFYDYEVKPEFRHVIKNARNRIENIYEQMLTNKNCAGAIFALKNFGWYDRVEVKTETNITISVIEGDLTERAESLQNNRLCSAN